MAAITWRNVGGGDTNGALRNLIAAGQGVTNSFDSLRGVVGDMEKAERQNMDRQKETNTNTFLDALQSRYKSPEELQAAIKSGEIDQFQQSFGKNINSGAARGAADARLTSLRQQGLAGMQYNNQVTDDTMISELNALTDGKKDTTIFFRADKTVDYETMMKVMDTLHQAGFLKIGLVGEETVKAK